MKLRVIEKFLKESLKINKENGDEMEASKEECVNSQKPIETLE